MTPKHMQTEYESDYGFNYDELWRLLRGGGAYKTLYIKYMQM